MSSRRDSESEASPQDRLDSWKEIAAYLKRGVRTVQRWETEEGLPVHRLQHARRGSVYAYKSEIDEWWQRRAQNSSRAASSINEAELRLELPDGTKQTITLKKKRVSVGRASDNDLPLPVDRTLSRYHLAFEPSEKGWVILDLGSKNGTYVNGQKIRDRRLLQHGDRIDAGSVRFHFLLPSLDLTSTMVSAQPHTEEVPTLLLESSLGELQLNQSNLSVEPTKETTASVLPEDFSRQALQIASRAISAVMSKPKAEGFLESVLGDVLTLLGVEDGAIFLLQDGELVLGSGRGNPLRVGAEIQERVLKEGLSVLVQITTSTLGAERAGKFESAQLLAVPIRSGDEVVGIIIVRRREDSSVGVEEELLFVTLIGQIVGVWFAAEGRKQADQMVTA